MRPRTLLRTSVPMLAAVALLTACSSAPSTSLAVSASATGCAVDQTTLKPGKTEIKATWTGDKTGEVYLYGKEGEAFTKVLGEVEDISSGLTKSFTTDLQAGTYEVACKNESNEAGIRTKITVS